MTPDSKIRHILQMNGLQLTEIQWQTLQKWANALQEINTRINLISRKDIDSLWEHHVLHCLALLIVRELPEGIEICDFGTGGGLPGILLAIVRPDIQWVLLDSRQKKIKAVQELVEHLQLSNVTTIAERGEVLGNNPKFRHRFSVFTVRAVSSLENLEVWTRQLRRSECVLHVYKGGDLTDEINTITKHPQLLKYDNTLLTLKDYSRLADEEKRIVSLYFSK